jgi:hypothetical protein
MLTIDVRTLDLLKLIPKLTTNSRSQTCRFNDDSGRRFSGDSTAIHISESSLDRL